MTSGYYQIPLEEDSKELTIFMIPQGRFTYNVSPMGLLPSGDTFNQRTQCLIEGKISGNLESLDDMAGGENYSEGMWERIKNLCETCKEKGIIFNPDKFHMGRNIKFGGFSVTRRIPPEGEGSTEISPQAH